ncbi:MAG: dicarboxylate/amino acid:cation symporter [bacterium]|nr:dicarboxylate/amino acid:cation symporter [bacterium]
MKPKLHIMIFLSIILGIIAGYFLQENAVHLEFLGKIFIRLLRMVIVPLVFASLVVGIVSLGNIRNLGKLGAKTMVLFISTTLTATFTGLLLANIIKPGTGSDLNFKVEQIPEIVSSKNMSITSVLTEIVPTNIIEAMSSDNMLGIIFFSIVLGCVLTVVGERGKHISKSIEGLNEVMLKMIEWIMLLAPVGVFALIASLTGRIGFSAFKPLAVYMATVIIGLLLHTTVILLGAVKIYAKYSPLRFIKHMFPAIATAFSTDSSISTLPVTMDCLERNTGISKKVIGFVTPLGATMNMDGTALFQTVAVMFIAQVYGIDLSFSQQILIAITATLASIGAAGIPSAGLITMAIILKSVNVPLEGLGLILAVDRLLDMFRTTVNVFGDTCCAAIIAKSDGEELYK